MIRGCRTRPAGSTGVGAAIAVPRKSEARNLRWREEEGHPVQLVKTQTHRRGPREDAIDAIECDVFYFTSLSIMTHLTDALSGIVRQFYIDPAHFPDGWIVVGSQLGWTSIATW